MKKFYLIVSLVMICVSRTNGQDVPSATSIKPIGKVQSYTEAKYILRQTGATKQAAFKSKVMYTLDMSGKIKEETIYNRDGSIVDKISYKRDNKGNRLEVSNMRKSLGSKTSSTKDKDGNKIEKVVFASGDTLIKKFDSKNRKVKDLMMSSKDTGFTVTFVYNKNGLLAETTSSFYKPRVVSTTKFNYDDAGKMTARLIFTSGKLINKHTFGYDKKGSLVSIDTYNADGMLTHKQRYSYESFDKNGNWQKLTEYYDNNVREMTDRKISYY